MAFAAGHRPRRAIMTALAAAALAALAACGDGSSSEQDDEPPAEKGTLPIATYVERADRICTAGRNDARRALRPLVQRLQRDGSLSRDDVMEVNEAGADAVRPLQRQLDALERPSTKHEAVDAYLKANAETLAALDEAVAAHRRDDESATNDALRRNRAGAARITRSAREVGFKSCGTEFSSNSTGS